MAEKTTPMMQQWHSCKKKVKNALVLFRLGDFYEAFYEDAKIVSKQLDLTLTQRQKVPMCGIPFYTIDNYIDELIKKGFQVAVAEQMEDAQNAKGIVKRDIVRVVSAGTLINSSLLNEKHNNFFACLTHLSSIFGLALLDLTTAEFSIMEIDSLKTLKDELYKLRPSELLISRRLKQELKEFLTDLNHGFQTSINEEEDWFFDFKSCHDFLTDHFEVHLLDGFGLKGKTAAIIAAGALMGFLKEKRSLALSHITTIYPKELKDFLAIDIACMRHLELLESFSFSKETKSTLLEVLDFTKTPMGGRKLKEWLKHPLVCTVKIQKRQTAIRECLTKKEQTQNILTYLSKIKDIERLIMKITSNFATPKDLVSLKLSLQNIDPVKKLLENNFTSLFLQEIAAKIEDLTVCTGLLEKALVDNPPLRVSDGGVIRRGYNVDLDELRALSRSSLNWANTYQNKLKEETGIKNLKVGFTNIFGYYIEVSKSNLAKAPDSFIRKQTLVNAERFITPELKSFEEKIFSAEEKIAALEQTLYSEIKAKTATWHKAISTTSQAIADLDSLISLTEAACQYNYSCPEVTETDIIDIKEGRHPIIEAASFLEPFIPNDVFLDGEENQLYLITGPNMSGKSTYLRQTALIVIMAQMGSFVPAKKATVGLVDKVFSRIGASDDLIRGQSTFMVEMSEAANILNNATNRSLIILDEIGRGTSTYDGIAIAWAIAEFLLTQPEKKAKTLFATHYSELTELEGKISGAINYQVAVEETENGIVFLRKIVKGGTDKSYGLHVARLAGLPKTALKLAKQKLKILEKKRKAAQNVSSQKLLEVDQMSFFDKPVNRTTTKTGSLIHHIKQLDIEKLTPIEAFQKLIEIKKEVQNQK